MTVSEREDYIVRNTGGRLLVLHRDEFLGEVDRLGVSKELAAFYGVGERQVQRWARRLSVKLDDRRAPPLTGEQKARAITLLGEGMPASWVAEDLGVDHQRILRIANALPRHGEATKSWSSVWGGIRHKENLRDLHAEFAPPKKIPGL